MFSFNNTNVQISRIAVGRIGSLYKHITQRRGITVKNLIGLLVVWLFCLTAVGAFSGVALAGGGVQVYLQMYSLDGKLLASYSTYTSSRSLSFQALDNNSRPLANGVYLAVVTIQDAHGDIVARKVEKIVVLRGKAQVNMPPTAHDELNALPASKATLIPQAPSGISEWAVVSEAFSWLGVPYKWGGEDRSGVDCSGLVRQVYMRASGGLAYYKDRTAAGIKERSYPVYPPKAGDVVLFRNKATGKWDHVGIYLWNGYFIHASSRAGKVILDHLYYSPYYGTGWWGKHYDIRFGRYDPDFMIS